MAVLLKAHVVVIVTTGSFSSAVETYAKELSATTVLQAVLVNGELLDDYRKKGAPVLREYFRDRAHQTLAVKRPQVAREVDEH